MIEAVLTGAVRGGTSILYASLGETVSERSGVINLGIEGSMLCGALAAYAAGIEQVLARVRVRRAASPASPQPTTLVPQQPPPPPPCAPSWDAWALAECSARPATPPAQRPADGKPAAAVLTVTMEDTDAADPR